MMSAAALGFERVTKVYQGRQVALADISFQAPAGATVGLLGANGSGKSTLLRIALGLISPTAGRVRIFGKTMSPAAKALRQRLGFLSDDPTFPKDLTAIRYLQFVGRCYGLAGTEREARMGTLLRAVGLTDDAGRRIGTYSTGMRTRLGIAASLMNDPDLLVWDEPTAGLDPISRRQTLELLQELRGQKTVILSSHILGDIDRVCDHLVILNQGQLLFDGTSASLEERLPRNFLELEVSGAVGTFRAAVQATLGRRDYSGDQGKVRLELLAKEPLGDLLRTLLNLAAESETTIDGVSSANGRLEDAYLKLITDDEFRGFLRAQPD